MTPQYIQFDKNEKRVYKDREMTILHCEDGPAIEWADGSKYWYLNGKVHREDGPAVEYPNGYKAWYFNDERHREDGPAVEYPSGDKAWWFEGKEYSKEEFLRLTAKEIVLTFDEIAAKFGVDASKLKISK